MLDEPEVILVQEVLINPSIHLDATEEASDAFTLFLDVETIELVLAAGRLPHGLMHGHQEGLSLFFPLLDARYNFQS